MAIFRRILVPSDFTETSDRALDWAIDLAAAVGAPVTVIHSYEIPILGFPDASMLPTPDISRKIAEAAKKGLDALVDARRARGVALDAILREGVAWEQINAVAEDVNADLIVIGTHGRKGIARALLGSVAENVIRTSRRPVLTIHGPRD
ncbi:MAG TPA: universal stress protein [Polyangiaceae bacterium]